MNQHYSSGTISAPKNCNRCGRKTQHRVGGDHKAHDCLVCLYKLDPGILSVDERSTWDIGLSRHEKDLAFEAARESRTRIVREIKEPVQGGLF